MESYTVTAFESVFIMVLVLMTGGGRRTARSRTKPSADANDGNEDQEKPHFQKHVRNKARNHSSIRIFNVDLKFMLRLSVFPYTKALQLM